MTWDYAWPELKIHLPASRLVCQKNVRKHKAAVKTRMTVLKMRITGKQKCDRNVCELWIAECALFRF